MPQTELYTTTLHTQTTLYTEMTNTHRVAQNGGRRGADVAQWLHHRNYNPKTLGLIPWRGRVRNSFLSLQLLCRRVSAWPPFVTQTCVHVKDPISICHKRVGLTAAGLSATPNQTLNARSCHTTPERLLIATCLVCVCMTAVKLSNINTCDNGKIWRRKLKEGEKKKCKEETKWFGLTSGSSASLSWPLLTRQQVHIKTQSRKKHPHWPTQQHSLSSCFHSCPHLYFLLSFSQSFLFVSLLNV